MKEKLHAEMHAERGYIQGTSAGSKDRYLYTSCSCRQGESGQAKFHERRVCIYQAQVMWICLWDKQIRETTVDVTLQTSFGSGEILEFEETVVVGIFSNM